MSKERGVTQSLISKASDLLYDRELEPSGKWRDKAKVWLSRNDTEVIRALVSQAAEIDRLRSLLPQTADGVLVADCEVLYCAKCETETTEDLCGDKILQWCPECEIHRKQTECLSDKC